LNGIFSRIGVLLYLFPIERMERLQHKKILIIADIEGSSGCFDYGASPFTLKILTLGLPLYNRMGKLGRLWAEIHS